MAIREAIFRLLNKITMDIQLSAPLATSRPITTGQPITADKPAAGRSAAARLIFVDNLRWVMIMLVLSMHAAVTYSGHGSWYYNEPAHLGLPQELTFVTYQVFLQSFFMGLLFFIAGHFVPGAVDKKGVARFLRDRAFRLGLPALLYIFVVQPLTCYYAAGVWDTDQGFLKEYRLYIIHGRFLSGTGPLWFCVALLFFSCCYAVWRSLRAARPVRPQSFPPMAIVGAFITLIALSTFFVRIPWPNGTSFYNMQFCYFSQYIFFFIAGTFAYRHSWLSTLTKSTSRNWGRIGRIGGLTIWILLILFDDGRPSRHGSTSRRRLALAKPGHVVDGIPRRHRYLHRSVRSVSGKSSITRAPLRTLFSAARHRRIMSSTHRC